MILRLILVDNFAVPGVPRGVEVFLAEAWGGHLPTIWVNISRIMRLLYVADGRSPIAQNWIRNFVEQGDEVFLASTFACKVDFPLKGFHVVPVAFSGTATAGSSSARRSARAIGLRTVLRHFFGPLTIARASKTLRGLVERIEPDLVHALRIPYEGMLAADAYTGIPLLVSVWGNDFTLHAPSNGLMRHYTSWTMAVADALHADCQRDIRLARQWGFDLSRPTLVTPGSGGVQTDIFRPPSRRVEDPVVVNPRGFRAYVRNDVFFQAIPLVLSKRPEVKFRCVAMEGEAQALKWIRQLGIEGAVELLPSLPHAAMADIFRTAQVMVSNSVHDGTPNTLLEGMACGCFPIAGDLDSIREWITPGKNGLLVDASSPASLAGAILDALENENLRRLAAGLNARMIQERAEYRHCMSLADHFYRGIVESHARARPVPAPELPPSKIK